MKLLLSETMREAERLAKHLGYWNRRDEWKWSSIGTPLYGWRFEEIVYYQNPDYFERGSNMWCAGEVRIIEEVLPRLLRSGCAGNISFLINCGIDDQESACNSAWQFATNLITPMPISAEERDVWGPILNSDTERGSTMNYSTSVLLVNENIRTVKGLYEEHGKPEIFKTVDKDLKVDDFAVVESTTRWNMTTVKIIAVDVTDEVDFDSSCQMKWAIGKIGKEDHDNLKKMESDLIAVMKVGELRKRREEIKKNVLDAKTAGELDNLAITKLAAPRSDAT